MDNKNKYSSESFGGIEISTNHILSDKDDFSEIDVFFSPVFATPEFLKNYPQISCYTILYDTIPLLFPQYFDRVPSWFHTLSKTLNANDSYIAISESAKSDFLKYSPKIDPQKIDVALIATNLDYKPHKNHLELQKVKAKYNLPSDKKYIFSLCSLEPRKNLIRAVSTFLKFISKNKIDDLVFVLGGSAWSGFIEKFEKEVPDYAQYKDKIIRAGRVDDEDLEILYSNAEWFVYTSQYEGFGMPPLEAMACGCPVITSNNSSLPEVVGDAGQMIDWDSDEQHISAYEKYYFNPKFRDEMAQKGLKRSKQFSWDKCVDVIMKRIEETQARKAQKPLVTIITATYNLLDNGRKEWFVQNMASVRNQTYDNVEHLVIDGASTDGTRELLKEYQEKGWIRYISEPDNGIYDAMNKGILKAKGKYVVCLNSDDFYCDNHALEWLVSKAEEQQADACYGDAIRVEPHSLKIINYWSGSKTFVPWQNCFPNHQTFLIKTETMKRFGLYNTAYKVSADNVFLRRMVEKGARFANINKQIISFRDGGFSNSHLDIAKNDQITGLFEEYGRYHNLSYLDCTNLIHNRFLSLPYEEAINLGAKLEKSEWIAEYFKRLIADTDSIRQKQRRLSADADMCIRLFHFLPLYKKTHKRKGDSLKQKIWLLGIPVLKTILNPDKISYKLGFFLPILKIIERQQKKIWLIFGIPVFKTKKGMSFDIP